MHLRITDPTALYCLSRVMASKINRPLSTTAITL